MDDWDWAPVSLSSTLQPGTSAGAIVDGREIVVWRDASGVAHVWEDRCPHRGMRMSFGFVRGDHIACLYHGWRYDTAGRCRFIPAHPDLDVPATIRIPSYAVTEANGMIWTTFSSAPAAFPDLARQAVTPVRSLYIDAPLAAIVAAVDKAPPTPFTALGNGAARREAVAGARSLWTLAIGPDRLLLAGQPIDANHAALHIVIIGEASVYAGRAQDHFARWAERLRQTAEAAALSDAGVA